MGERNYNTINIAGNFAVALVQAGHADSAVTLLRRELQLADDALGPKATISGDTRIKLAVALVKQRHFGEAIAMATQGLRVIDSTFGRASPSAVTGRQQLLAAYTALGDSANATRVRAELADATRPAP